MKQVWLVILLVLIAASLWASPTGLNNIPTADVVPEKVLVFQWWTNIGEGIRPGYYAGFKWGPIRKLEVGADGKLGSDSSGPVTLQLKYQIYNFNFGLTPLIGMDNISAETDKVGKVNPYIVLTQDFKFLRIHLGHNSQDDNEAFFFGVDKTLKLFNQDLILRGDLKQVNGRDDLLGSLGFLLTLPYNFILESWFSIPTEDDKEGVFTAKLNYVIKF